MVYYDSKLIIRGWNINVGHQKGLMEDKECNDAYSEMQF